MFFEAYVRQWLLNTDSKTKSWVEAVGIHVLIYIAVQLTTDFFFPF